jgi:hypothetical protein
MKEVEHRDAYTMGGANIPASDNENEYWIKDKKIVFKSDRNKTYLFDLTEKKFLFINDKENTYVEISTPPELSRVLSDQLAAKYDMYKETGTVTKTDRTQKLQDKTCTGYEVKTWKDSGGIRFSERSAIVWATADVSFDLNVYYGMLRCIRTLYNRDEILLKNLDQIKGCQMGMDMIMVRQDTEIKITHKIVEMTQKKAPEDMFSVPKDYTKKEKLSFNDLWR